MTESLMGFTQGFLLVLVAFAAWNAFRTAREWVRRITHDTRTAIEALSAPDGSVDLRFRSMQEAVQHHLERLRQDVAQQGTGASDAAIAQLATRISALEKQLAQQDLTILDTAERVAHKLQDRRRKRDDAAEVGDVDDAPNDPNFLLARARAQHPDPAFMGGRQIELLPDEAAS